MNTLRTTPTIINISEIEASLTCLDDSNPESTSSNKEADLTFNKFDNNELNLNFTNSNTSPFSPVTAKGTNS